MIAIDDLRVGGAAILLVLAGLIRWGIGALDRDRIKYYLEKRSATLLKAGWCLFGRGWLGWARGRTYRIVYRDGDGCDREAYGTKSLGIGVRITEDQIVGVDPEAQADRSATSLEEENRRLRDGVERPRGETS